MYPSDFHLKKRQQEQKQLQKLLIASFVGSTLLHGVLFAILPSWGIFKSPRKVAEPIELILVDKPKPTETKIIPKPKPIPIPKVKTPPPPPKPKPIPTPKVKTTPPPKPKPISTPKSRTQPPPKSEAPPSPNAGPSKPVLTNSNATVNNAVPVTPFQTDNTEAVTGIGTANGTGTGTGPTPPTSGLQDDPLAINSSPPEPPKPTTDPRAISCVANCQPKYPSALDGAEGSAGVRLTMSSDGQVTGAELVQANNNSLLNREALLAARRMKFNKIDNEAGVLVVVKINFTVKGSEFDRLARERQEQLERERQAKLEAERKKREEEARQAELEQQRQAELQQEQESTEEPTNPNGLTEKEREAEMIRKFRERIESIQDQ